MQNLPSVEGLTPETLWWTFAGLVALGTLYVLYGKVRKTYRDEKAAKNDAQAEKDGTIQGQLNKISKRLADIESYMRESDERFERDNRRLNTLERDTEHISQGINALARAELAHLQHDITGNHTDNLGIAEREITDYLTRKG